jgi:TonB-dependent receptor
MWSKYLRTTTGLVVLSMLSVPAVTFAQGTGGAAAAPADDTVIVVTGVRASQRSSIDRKKKAATATDSIVAEDVGKFPDKNIGEAISRIAGVALDRGSFNEGGEVALRGVGSSQTNVELDGLGVQNTSISGTLNGVDANATGRNKTFQEFPADLIKSVDVVKGSTASMTEGGLGGSILIQSRTGLDFKKPFFSFRFDETQNSLSQKWTPEFNIIASRKFLGNRLGILLNYSNSTVYNDNSSAQPVTSGNAGLFRSADFDNSLEKTFTFNPDTVSKTDAAATQPVGLGSSLVTFESPLSLVTKSAGAKTKADCYALFPALTTAQVASFGSSTSSAARTARGVQTGELQTCLNQWNDYTPSLVRYFTNQDIEHRQTLDLRADYKVNNDLTVFAKFNMNKRNINNTQQTFQQGQFAFNTASVSTPTFNGVPWTLTTAPGNAGYGTLNQVAGSGYYIYDGISTQATENVPVRGVAVNVDPTTVVVDKSHHVIAATITDGNINTDQLHNTNQISSTYLSAGGTYQHGGFKADFLFGDAKSKYTRYDRRTSLTYTYGPARMTFVSGAGLWNYQLPAGFDQTDPSLYSIVRPATGTRNALTLSGTDPGLAGQTGAYTVAQQPATGIGIGLQLSPKESDTEEKTAKVDLTYDFANKIPFITTVRAGINLRDSEAFGWGGGGRTVTPENTHLGTTPFVSDGAGGYVKNGYVPPVILPTQNLRGTLRACDDTKYGTGSTAAPAGAMPCNYGYVANTNLNNVLYGTFTVRPADLQALVSQVFLPRNYTYMQGFPDKGNLFDGWSQLDVDKIYALVSQLAKDPRYSSGGDPLANYNFSCLKVCKASDGKMYDMPFSHSLEKTTAAYLQIDFEQNLPFDMVFNGNVGERYVKTETNASSYVTLASVRCLSTPCNSSTQTSNTVSVNASLPVAISANTTDWLPSYNYNLWMIPDKLVFRYNAAMVMARPPITRLLPAGSCTVDERFATALDADGSSADGGCGTFGNPALKPYKSRNHNWSLEYYPTKDMQFSYSVYKNDVINGDIQTVPVTNAKLFAGTGVLDPVTGQTIDNQEFQYTTYTNGQPLIRRGAEYAIKSAFTFLPWKLKYTGFDGNYATVHSSAALPARDLITGDALKPRGEASYYINASLWYDDGTTTARISYQSRDQTFNCISACGTTNTVNNYPNDSGIVAARPIPYNPGSAYFDSATQYVDLKVNHKLNKETEVFLAVNNVLKEHTQTDGGPYNVYSDGTPVVYNLNYPGYRVTMGFTFRH